MVISRSLRPQLDVSRYRANTAVTLNWLWTTVFTLWTFVCASLSCVEIRLAANRNDPIKSSLSDLNCRIVLVVSTCIYVRASSAEELWLIKDAWSCWYSTFVQIGYLLLLIDNRVLRNDHIVCPWLKTSVRARCSTLHSNAILTLIWKMFLLGRLAIGSSHTTSAMWCVSLPIISLRITRSVIHLKNTIFSSSQLFATTVLLDSALRTIALVVHRVLLAYLIKVRHGGSRILIGMIVLLNLFSNSGSSHKPLIFLVFLIAYNSRIALFSHTSSVEVLTGREWIAALEVGGWGRTVTQSCLIH